MTTPTYNRLMTRKLIGAINHLLHGHHAIIPADVLRRIISAHLRELQGELPARKFGGIVSKLVAENDAGNAASPEFAAGLDLLASMLPLTYGMIPAGASFTVSGAQFGCVFTKRKDGVQGPRGFHGHAPADRIVTLL